MTNEKTNDYRSDRRFSEGIISAISAGISLILLGVVFAINQNLSKAIYDFSKDFTTVPVSQSNFNFFVPASVASHAEVYLAAFQFALGIGILQILILALRLSLGSGKRRTAQTCGNVIFWFGTAYMLNNLANIKSTLAISQQQIMWWQFWAGIIILIGLSILAQAAVLFASRKSPVSSKTEWP